MMMAKGKGGEFGREREAEEFRRWTASDSRGLRRLFKAEGGETIVSCCEVRMNLDASRH